MRNIKVVACFAALTALSASAAAQEWPTRPVTMVVPYAAGSASDLVARIIAPRLSEHLGKQVIVENVPGAGGMTASVRVSGAAPDFYQFVLGNAGTHAQNQTLYKSPLYDAAIDFAPVALIATSSYVLIARNDLPANNLQEFIAYTRENQAKMQFGSAGPGSGIHLACLLLNAAIGVNVTHVPYRGSPPAMQDLIADRIDYMCPIDGSVVGQIRSGSVKALAILTKNRSPILPDLASASEQGLAGFDVSGWWGIFLPKGTPAPIVQRLHDATVAMLDTPSFRERMTEIGAGLPRPDQQSSQYLSDLVKSEIEKWAPPIKASGIVIE